MSPTSRSDSIAVMYLGRIVEIADRDALFKDPRHPYTEAQLESAEDGRSVACLL